MTPRIVLTLTIGLAAGAVEGGTLVAFHDKASTAAGIVTLGDVADVRGDDAAVVQKMTTIILGPAPDAGRETSFAFESIRSRLMAAGMNLADVEFSGSASVAVRGAAPPVVRPTERSIAPPRVPKDAPPALRTRVEQAVEAAIRRYLDAQGATAGLCIAPELSLADSVALGPAATQGFDVSGGAAPWTGSQLFTLRFLDETETPQAVRVSCVVSQRPSVIVPRQALPKGHILRADDLVWKPLDEGATGPAVTDPGQLIGRETQQNLRSGQPIPPEAVRSVPLVRTGQFVNVTSRRPGVAIQRVMKAKSNGASGETIAATTLEDHKTVIVRVTGLQEAEVVDQAVARSSDPAGPQESQLRAVNPIAIGLDPSAVASSLVDDRPRVLVNPSQPLSVPDGSTNE